MEILLRRLPAVLPLCATTSPTSLNWVTPAMTGAGTVLPMVVLPGLLLLAAWVVFLDASVDAPGRFAMAPVAAIAATPARRPSMPAGSVLATARRRSRQPFPGSRRWRGSGLPGALRAAG